MTKRINRGDRIAVLHYITLNVREKKRAFSHDVYARIALTELRRHCDLHPAKLIAYSAMPTHLHAILNPRDGQIQRFLADYKPDVTRAISAFAHELGQQTVIDWLYTPDGHDHLWQEGKHDLYLYSERLIWQKIDYIHNNPIKAGLVRRADEYPYSSFRAMYPGYGEAIVPIDKDFWWEDLPLILE